MDTITVRIKNGPAGPYEVKVSEVGGLDLSCSCGESLPGHWCRHIYAVVCGDRAALARSSEVSNLTAAEGPISRHIDVIEVLRQRLEALEGHPESKPEAEAIKAAIAKRQGQEDRLE